MDINFILRSPTNKALATEARKQEGIYTWVEMKCAERSSLPDSSSGVSSRMWVRIPAVALVSLSIIASLHPGVGLNGYLWGQSWLISPICAVMAAIELYIPQGAEIGSGMIYEPYEQG